MDFQHLAQQLLNGLSIGIVYAVFALGYALVFSVLRMVNFGHAAVFTLGAYFTYVLEGGHFGFNGLLANGSLPVELPFPAAMILGSLLAGLVAVIIERVAFRPLRNKGADPLLLLVSSLGVAIFIVNVIQYLVGAEIYTFAANAFGNLPPAVNFGSEDRAIPIRSIQIIIFVISMGLLAALTYLINYTKFGKALRAVAEDTVTASLLGIDTDRIITATFFLSGVLGGIAGTLLGVSVSIAGPYFGVAFGLKGLAILVLGGLGSIPGVVVGGLIIGIAEALVPSNLIAYKEAVAFALLFLVLLVRPQGLLGRPVVQKV